MTSVKKEVPKISVLLCTYNDERYLREAIDSILAQTYRDFEFIIINDASTDGTAAILASYDDPRIIARRNETNLGLTKSLNIGLAMARGEYVARMDADDIALPDRLEKEKTFLDTHPDVVCAGGKIIIIDEHGCETGRKQVITDPELLRFRNVFANQLAHPTVIFRRAVIVGNGGYNEDFRYVQDYELWSRLLERNYILSNLDEPILRYRYHAKSITQGPASKKPAYIYATKVMQKNLSHYVSFSTEEFTWVLESSHHHTVESLTQALSTISLLRRFKKTYLEKERISPETRSHIENYILREQIETLRWYAKRRLGIVYETVARVARMLRKNKK